ncbi:uncharacterized protein A1O5_07005 [Cladophialophora psammophila CBS 110553]|uniref:2,3-bisphosphoglycerate-dependent phosphoglycerate mutase n=1 Tax=Cladophialophora psammophila CBS 110553 TaxID=1182543 RepID=W9WP35_9EURO|nr:uncharacterized protein A1O5_07005 [Cladophialophora psammophila CBS 110553]EXJ69932.1 hypothetical protein A1O5_07005 [Cladophialophora psammophila CBS 110553]
MSDKDAATPRLFLIRHGETEWSRNGRFTGITDLPLLPEGEEKVRQTASVVFGPGRLIDPSKVAYIACSPRQRAQRTLQLLLDQIQDSSARTALKEKINTTEDIAEWGYGDYEGLLQHQIEELRKSRGLDKDRPWDIWRDGCEGPGGHSPAQVTERLDRLISQVTWMHRQGLQKGDRKCDAVVVAHGHILRAFVKRWLKLDMDAQIEMMLEPGGVCGLSYAHGDVEYRAVLVGMSFPASL